jgi:serine/threonine protein phosphatase PrpC
MELGRHVCYFETVRLESGGVGTEGFCRGTVATGRSPGLFDERSLAEGKHRTEASLKVGFKTTNGHIRPTNQDSLHADEGLGLFIVADGMGGHNAGEVASSIAVQEIVKTIRDRLACGAEATPTISDSIREAHHAIFQNSQKKPEWYNMGTTVVLALFHLDRVLISHVGDSRAYAIKDGTIKPLTEDHSFVAEWVKQGIITPEEARTHRARHGLTMALGVDDVIETVVTDLPREQIECLLLCSDGLTDILDDAEILDTVSNVDDPQTACDLLVQRANEKGGQDDITVILIC